MKNSLIKALASAAVISFGLPIAADAQSTVPAYTQYSTTGQPSGSFTLPSVPLQRRSTLQQAYPPQQRNIFNPTTQSTQQGSSDAAAQRPNITPSAPENPNALATGRSITAQDQAKEQSASTGQVGTLKTTSTSPGAPTYTAGMIVTGKAKVYDGHSLLVDGVPVRLDGADAPGLLQTCQTTAGMAWRCGEQAYRRLKDLVEGRKIVCRVTAQIGTGAAAICSETTVGDVAKMMVAEGLAVPNGHDSGRYAGTANAARTARAGMWVGSFEAPWKWRAGRNG